MEILQIVASKTMSTNRYFTNKVTSVVTAVFTLVEKGVISNTIDQKVSIQI